MSRFPHELYYAIALHVFILIALTLSVNLHPPQLPDVSAPSVIQATFIDADAVAAAQRLQAEQEAARKRAAEQQRQQKLAAEKAAQQRKAEQAKKAAEAKKQRELQRLAEQQALERKAREEAEKAEQARAEKAAKAAEQKAEQARREAEQRAAEQAEQQRRRQQQVLSEVERYQALIKQTIMRYLIKDESFKGKTCRLNIRLASTGLVTKVTRLSGDDALCLAAQSAVLRPDKLPMSSEADVYEKLKDINLTVEL